MERPAVVQMLLRIAGQEIRGKSNPGVAAIPEAAAEPAFDREAPGMPHLDRAVGISRRMLTWNVESRREIPRGITFGLCIVLDHRFPGPERFQDFRPGLRSLGS